MNLQNFLERLQERTGGLARPSGSGYSVLCPAHADKNPSLSISEDNKGNILMNCHAGCPCEKICSTLGLEMKDLFNTSSDPTVKTIYIYQDEKGQELYRKIRIEPGLNGKTKSFYFEHVDASGNTIKNLKGCRRVLYRLPDVLKGISENKTIFLVEGEKDADKLHQLGLIATTTSDTLYWPNEFSQILKEAANLVILYDMDKTGLQRRDLLIQNLSSLVKNLRVVDLPGLQYQDSHGADVSDWLKTGHTSQELLDIVANTPLYYSQDEKKGVRGINVKEFLEMVIPEKEMLIEPFLPMQGLAMIYAKRGVGKTHAAIGVACAVASGGRFLKWSAPKPRKVLYIDGEMPAYAMQERLHKFFASSQFGVEARKNFTLITPDLQNIPMPDLATHAGQMSIDHLIEENDLIIIDNLSCLVRSRRENVADDWQPIQDWLLELRRRGKSIILINHAGKNETNRGTSKIEDVLDSVICLKHPTDYRADQGARFEIHYEKNRHFYCEEAASFTAQLYHSEDDQWKWEISLSQTDLAMQTFVELHQKGLSIRESAKEMKLTKSSVETLKKKAKANGLI